MRYIMRKMTNTEKEEKFIEIMEYLFITVNFELYDIEELMDSNAYDY